MFSFSRPDAVCGSRPARPPRPPPAPGARPAAGGHVILDGRKRLVIDGHAAELLLVVARAPGTSGADGLAVYEVPVGASGVGRRRLPTLDATRALAEVTLADVRVPD